MKRSSDRATCGSATSSGLRGGSCSKHWDDQERHRYVRRLGGARFCDRRFNRVFVYHIGPESYYAARASEESSGSDRTPRDRGCGDLSLDDAAPPGRLGEATRRPFAAHAPAAGTQRDLEDPSSGGLLLSASSARSRADRAAQPASGARDR